MRCSVRPNSISAIPPSSAPIDGTVGNRSLRVGQYVQAGTQLMSVVPATGAYVVSEFQGNPAHRRAPGPGGRHQRRHVPGPDRARPRRQPRPRQRPGIRIAAAGQCHRQLHQGWCSAYPVKIALDDNALVTLRPGISVIPTIETRSPPRNQPAGRTPHPRFQLPKGRAMSNPTLSASISVLPILPPDLSAPPSIPTAPASPPGSPCWPP